MKMAHLAQELPASGENEKKFVDFVKNMVSDFKGADCRELFNPIRHAAGICGVVINLGCGGSHIWIHRPAEHVEGNPVESKRFMIVTDQPLWKNYWEEEAEQQQRNFFNEQLNIKA